MLDLGSGGGIDVILSARRVGPRGLAYGLDMTDEMLALAQRKASDAGVANAIFLRGVIEYIPLPAGSVDVVISNCVVNLSVDKQAVFAEIARVLRPGGRIGISDVIADDHLTVAERAERGSHVGCIAGALSGEEYVAAWKPSAGVSPICALRPSGQPGTTRSSSTSRSRAPRISAEVRDDSRRRDGLDRHLRH